MVSSAGASCCFTEIIFKMQIENCFKILLLIEFCYVLAEAEFEAQRLIRSPDDHAVPPTTTPPPSKAIPVPAPPGELYLPVNYNKLEIPKTRNLAGEVLPIPTRVFVHLNIRQILAINEADEELTLEMDMHVQWNDAALLHATLTYIPGTPAPTVASTSESNTTAAPPRPPKFFLGDRFRKPIITVLDPVFLKKIWRPDIFIENLLSVEQPDLMGKPAQLKWSSRGTIAYAARVKARVKCHFDFTFYPADTQQCDLVLRSYSHNQSALQIFWRSPTGLYLLSPSDDNYDLAVGRMRRFRHVVFLDPANRANNDSFDALRFTIFTRRLLSYHIMQTYVPSMLYIAITWLCFLIPKRMIEARMAVVMTTLLTLTAMFGSVRESTPVVSYTKAIDRWMVASIAFVFMVLLEFSLLLWTESNKEEKQKEDECADEPSQMPLVVPKMEEVKVKRQTSSIGQRLRAPILHMATITITFIENYSFILILILLASFNASYWSWLLLRSGYYDWHVNATHNAIGMEAAEEEDMELPVFV